MVNILLVDIFPETADSCIAKINSAIFANVEQFAKINSAKYQFLEASIAKINSVKINVRKN